MPPAEYITYDYESKLEKNVAFIRHFHQFLSSRETLTFDAAPLESSKRERFGGV